MRTISRDTGVGKKKGKERKGKKEKEKKRERERDGRAFFFHGNKFIGGGYLDGGIGAPRNSVSFFRPM